MQQLTCPLLPSTSRMSQSRCAYFCSGDEDATIAALSQALAPHGPFMAGRSTGLYTTMAMSGAPQHAELEAAQGLIMSLIALDARGGFFAQGIMEAALAIAIDAKGLFTTMQDLADKTVSPDRVVAVISYKIRVMMAHTRKLLDSSYKAAWFTSIAAHYKSHAGSALSRTRHRAKLAQRPHPFPFFRSADPVADVEAAADPDGEETDCSVVCKYMDYACLRAVLLQSDGAPRTGLPPIISLSSSFALIISLFLSGVRGGGVCAVCVLLQAPWCMQMLIVRAVRGRSRLAGSMCVVLPTH